MVRPILNDNRSYDYTSNYKEVRKEYSIIQDLISDYSKVIDLGCGDGTLLEILRDKNKAYVKGVELTPSGCAKCIEKKIEVLEGKIDTDLPFKDNEFDFSICNVTIQMVNYPEKLLSEMKRISKFQIISFPNFAFYKNRIEFFRKGKMPKKMLFAYKWYSTGHIHQLSYYDFLELLNDVGGLKIKAFKFDKTKNNIKNKLINRFPNLFCIIPILLLEKA